MDEREYYARLGEKKHRRLNQIICAVTARIPKSEIVVDEVEERFYDNLTKEAEWHLEKYGSWPTFELMELDDEDEELDIYGDESPAEWCKGPRPSNKPTLVEVPEWVKQEPEKYMTAIMTILLEWEILGRPTGTTPEKLIDREDWTLWDSEYIYNKLVEHGCVP